MLVENLDSTLNYCLKRRVVHKALRKFNAAKSDSNSNELRVNYIEERREYKQLLKQKRAVHKEILLKHLKKTRKMLESCGVRSNP